MSIAAHSSDPILETIARSVFALFPRCMKCGAPIERFEDADVRILTNRVVHRHGCVPAAETMPETT